MNKNIDYLLLCDVLDDVVKDKNRLGTPLFNKIAQLTPMVAVEIIFTDRYGRFFMSYREDEYFVGWHFPGRVLRYGRDLEQELNQLCKVELELSNFQYESLTTENYNQHIKRGHIVSFIYKGYTNETIYNGEWFSELPSNTIEDHVDLFHRLVNESLL